MPRVTCAFCGLPFSVRALRNGAEYFCCSGCALASRIPVHGDALPVSRGLVIALALGFGLFNEILFGVLGAALAAEGRAGMGGRWLIVSGVIGLLLFLTNLLFLTSTHPRRWTDATAGVITAGIAGWGIARGIALAWGAAAWPILGANAVMAAWWSRGWLRRAFARRRSRGG